MGENLMSSIKAVGLVGFSNVARAPELMLEAKKQYVVAVRLLNAALRSPAEVKKDTTLLAVMMLGIFETLTGREEISLVAWAAHLRGAAAVMKIRGPEQVATVAGRRLYGQITASLMTSCLQQEVTLPDHILDLSLELNKYVDAKDMTWSNQRVLLRFTNFYARVQRGGIMDLQEILNTSLELDDALVRAFTEIPHGWTYSTIYTDDNTSIVYDGCYHVYHHPLSALVWNGMRTVRIMLNKIMRHTLLKGKSLGLPLFVEPRYTRQIQTSTNIVYQLSLDIVASVPQHLGYTGPQTTGTSFIGPFQASGLPEHRPRGQLWSDYNSGSQRIPSWETTVSVPFHRTALYQLPWALYLVGSTDVVSKSVFRWVVLTLELLCTSFGIQQAALLAAKLEQTRPRSDFSDS